ncbi:MAG: CoA-binding protein, partial [Anaerolineales bacterium]
GMRLVGPNCVGVMDTFLPLDTTFITNMPAKGAIGFVSHSGAICGGTIDWANSVGVGFSRIVSLGNQLDVDIADGIHLLDQDANTRVISVYAEGLPDGRKFVDMAASVYRRKPIVMLKAGLTAAGSRAVSSHTGAMAGSAVAYGAACHRAGVLAVHTLQEQNDVAMALATQPLPTGNRVALLTNAGGPAALAADELGKYGLCLANLAMDTKMKLLGATPPGTQRDNPVDMLGGPESVMFRDAGQILLDDPGVDMLMSIFVPQALTPVNAVAQSVIDSARQGHKPVICCLVGGDSITEAVQLLNTNGVPFYQDPNRASRALAGLVQYQQLRKRESLKPIPVIDVDADRVRALLAAVWQNRGAGFIPPNVAVQILSAYGIPVPLSAIAGSAEEAIRIAEGFKHPVAIKIVADGIIHKADVGGIFLNLQDAAEVREAYNRIVRDNPLWRVLIQSMVPPGQEVIVGMQRDPQFGPLLMFGTGGAYVEISHDVAFRLAPLCRHDAFDMIRGTIAGQILQGVRGDQPRDIDSTVDVLLRVGQLANDFHCISELDINPLIISAQGEGCWAVDGRIAIDQMPV